MELFRYPLRLAGEADYPTIEDAAGIVVAEACGVRPEDEAARIVACLNALEGIADPAAFVAAADALRDATVATEDDPDLDAAKMRYDAARGDA